MVPTLEKIESGKVWSPSTLVPSTAATMTTVMRTVEQEKIRDSLRLDDLKIVTPKVKLIFVNKCVNQVLNMCENEKEREREFVFNVFNRRLHFISISTTQINFYEFFLEIH